MTETDELAEVLIPDPDFIERAYAGLRVQDEDFSFRPEQEDLSRRICEAFVRDVPFMAEAPTGTGKTLAYLIGALAAKEATNLPIVVATATVNLQDQIAANDVPLLVQAGTLRRGVALIAKGRGRYFCPQSAHRYLAEYGTAVILQNDLFEDKSESISKAFNVRDCLRLAEWWDSGEWNGDADDLPGDMPPVWELVKASSDTCIGHQCDDFDVCPFFAARKKLAYADLIIANQDLVLNDLAMSLEDRETLFPFKNYLLVLDEAHHFGQKAIGQGTARLEPKRCAEVAEAFGKLVPALLRNVKIAKTFDEKHVSEGDLDTAEASVLAHDLAEEIKGRLGDEGHVLFPGGKLPEETQAKIARLLKELERLFGLAQAALAAVKNGAGSKSSDDNAMLFLLVQPTIGLKEAVGHLKELVSPQDRARWVEQWTGLESSRLFICSSPLEGKDVLDEPLWQAKRVRIAMVSATLDDGSGRMRRYKASIGAPKTTEHKVYPHVFPYRENELIVPFMERNPKQDGYTEELAAGLLDHIKPEEGTLILFNSKAMMKEVHSALSLRYTADRMLMQDSGISAKNLVAEHKRRLDAGRGNILLGVQKLAEGLDLPGKYCTHVIIARLPFTPPDHPVEKERQNRIGPTYFDEYMLPDALLRLIQMVGRLMRKETDRGRVTIFDNRIVERRWGLKMLEALPPFRHKRSL